MNDNNLNEIHQLINNNQDNSFEYINNISQFKLTILNLFNIKITLIIFILIKFKIVIWSAKFYQLFEFHLCVLQYFVRI